MAGQGYFRFTKAGTQIGTNFVPAASSSTMSTFDQSTSSGNASTVAYPLSVGSFLSSMQVQSATAAPQTYNSSGLASSYPSYNLAQQQQQSINSASSGWQKIASDGANTYPIGYTSNTAASVVGGALSSSSGALASASSSTASTYTGYEAAVFNAATEYIKSRNRNTGGGGGGGYGGRGTFPKKNSFFAGKSPSTQNLTYCDICKISCAGSGPYREHLEGKNHKRKAAMFNSGAEQQSLSKNRLSFRCDLCSVTCTGQDTYNAHIRGTKHQKTLKLHQTLKKPIPSTEPTIIPPAQAGRVLESETKKVVVVPTLNFVGGRKLHTTSLSDSAAIAEQLEAGENSAPMSMNLMPDKDVLPVGEDYLESQKDATGKLIAYHCKLCDCQFTDTAAKDMHLKGRRHRLQFKAKVDPSLEVEIKDDSKYRSYGRRGAKSRSDIFARPHVPAYMQSAQPMQDLWSIRNMYQSKIVGMASVVGPPMPLFPTVNQQTTPAFAKRTPTLDDKYVITKHASISPTEDEINTTQLVVINVEKSLKSVSDSFLEKNKANGEPSGEDARLMRGVMRVGDLAKQLLLRGDSRIDLVVLCLNVPTVSLLKNVLEVLPEHLTSHSEENYELSLVEEDAGILVVRRNEPRVEVHVTFTSVAVRNGEKEVVRGEGSDALDKQKCLDALASLRHAKWFQVRCTNLQGCPVVLRILKDLCQRVPTWAPFTYWPLELLIEKIICSATTPPTATETLRHFFEAVAAGIVMPKGPGLMDPCEKQAYDALNILTVQQREDITASAQHMLRQIAFGQIYNVLGMENFNDGDGGLGGGGYRKRALDKTEDMDTSTVESNGKKDKK